MGNWINGDDMGNDEDPMSYDRMRVGIAMSNAIAITI